MSLAEFHPIDANELVIDEVKNEGRNEQDRAEGACLAPIVLLIDRLGDEARDHLIGRAADERRCYIVAEAEYESEQTSGGDARKSLRHIDFQERVKRSRA